MVKNIRGIRSKGQRKESWSGNNYEGKHKLVKNKTIFSHRCNSRSKDSWQQVSKLGIYPTCAVSIRSPGGWFNIKMSSYQYRDSHVKDKTVSPTVLSLTWESPYLGKTVFILNQDPGVYPGMPQGSGKGLVKCPLRTCGSSSREPASCLALQSAGECVGRQRRGMLGHVPLNIQPYHRMQN